MAVQGQRHPLARRTCPALHVPSLRLAHATLLLVSFEFLLLLHSAHSGNDEHHRTLERARPPQEGLALAAVPLTLDPRGRHLLDVGSLSTTQFVIVIICSVLGFLLVVAVILLILLAARRQEAVVPLTDPQVLQMAANTAAAMQLQHKPPAADAYAEYPHPLLLRRQIQAELIAQQQAALRGNGPTIDALALAKQLMCNGQLQAAHSVAYHAGVLHLLPGLQEQMARGGVQMATPYPYHTPESLQQQQQREQQLDYGAYNAVYSQALAQQQQLQGAAMYAQPSNQQQQQYYSQQPSQAQGGGQYAQPAAQQQYSETPQQQHAQPQQQLQRQYTRGSSGQQRGDAGSDPTAAGSGPQPGHSSSPAQPSHVESSQQHQQHQHQQQQQQQDEGLAMSSQAAAQDPPVQPHS